MKRIITVTVLLCTLLAGCTKPAKKDIIVIQTDRTPPTPFTVKVTDREDTYAQIQWTQSVSADTTLVTYSVTLNGVKIVAGLTDISYKILNLTDTLAYTGQVIATDKKGLMTTDTFTIHKAPGILYSSTDQNFNCLTLGGDQRWSIPGMFPSYPVISNDTVFAQGFNIVALNAKTGVQYWSYAANENGGGLVYYGGMLFTNLPQSNKILAINAKTGSLAWELSGGGAYQPTISKGILYYENPDGLGNSAFIALNAKTGAPIWNLNLSGEPALPVTVNGTTFIQNAPTDSTNSKGYLYALDARTGAHKWTFSFPGWIGPSFNLSRPVVIGNLVYFLAAYYNNYSNTNSLYAVNITDGTLKWQKSPFVGGGYGSVFGGPDGVYVNAYQVTEKFDLNTGALLWADPNNSSQDDAGVMDVTVAPGALYFHQYSGYGSYLQPFNSTTGVWINSAQNVPDAGGYIIVIDRKAHYPYPSGMNSTN